MPATWLVVGASRGIGLEFVRQLLNQGDQVIAAVRTPSTANKLWQLSDLQSRPASLLIEQCDVTREQSIEGLMSRLKVQVAKGLKIDYVVLNAGILKYPNRATEITFSEFALHLHTNTIGPIIAAQQVLTLSNTSAPSKIIFISSDSGSTAQFRAHEDGFGAYAASKAALNQMLRHMAAELQRKSGIYRDVCVLAMHPGEVTTDMANDVELDWEVEGIISPKESIEGMLKVIDSKTGKDTGTFWCWDGREHPW